MMSREYLLITKDALDLLGIMSAESYEELADLSQNRLCGKSRTG